MGVRKKLVTHTYLLKYFTNVNVPFEKLNPVNSKVLGDPTLNVMYWYTEMWYQKNIKARSQGLL